MKLFILIAVLCSFSVSGQQNLVPNGSFERVRDDVFNALNDAQTVNSSGNTFVTSHLASHDTTKGLFHCWEFWVDQTAISSEIHGVVYGIVPGLYPSTGGNSGIASEIPQTSVINDNNEDYIYYSNSGEQGMRLIQTPNGLQGLDCSPPNTRFGENIAASHGENYLALMDMEYPGGPFSVAQSGRPYFGTYLKQNLQKDLEYVLVFSIAKMNRLDDFQANEGWTNIEDPEIEFHIGNLANNGVSFANKEQIHKQSYTNGSWQEVTVTFTPSRDYEYLRINLNCLGAVGSDIELTGCFLDNIKIYEACEDPFNQCNNTNYKRDLLDVSLEGATVYDPLAYPDPNHGSDNFLESVKAVNLDNVKRLEMEIRNSGGTIVRTIDEWYPPSQFIWDGNDDGGDPLPEGSYEAKIRAVSNDCPNFHISNADVKNFNLKRRYTVFGNVQIATTVVPSGNGNVTIPAITGLDQVQWLRVKISDFTGQEVFNQAYYNPPAEMLLSTSFGTVTSNPPPSTGPYGVQLEMSNNCQSANLGNNWDHYVSAQSVTINAYTNYNVDPNLFNWVGVPKPDFQCPYDIQYADNYLSPRDCCEGSLYIENVEILNDFGVQVQDNIYFGENVSFGTNSNNSFYAGEVIFGEPGLTIPNGANIILQPGTYTCMVCREANPNSPPRVTNGEFAITDMTGNKDQDEALSTALYPNPVKSGNEVYVSLLMPVDETAKFVLLDATGKEYYLDANGIRGNEVSLKTPKGLSEGIYYLQVSTSSMIQSFKLQIKK